MHGKQADLTVVAVGIRWLQAPGGPWQDCPQPAYPSQGSLQPHNPEALGTHRMLATVNQ